MCFGQCPKSRFHLRALSHVSKDPKGPVFKSRMAAITPRWPLVPRSPVDSYNSYKLPWRTWSWSKRDLAISMAMMNFSLDHGEKKKKKQNFINVS